MLPEEVDFNTDFNVALWTRARIGCWAGRVEGRRRNGLSGAEFTTSPAFSSS